MNNTLVKRVIWLAAILAAGFFVDVLVAYGHAGALPAQPGTRQASAFNLLKTARPAYRPGRYAGLAGGRIFFGEPIEETAVQPQVYISSLMLRGIVYSDGREPVAVFTLANAKPEAQSWAAKVGQIVNEEKVIAINKDNVVLTKDGLETVLFLP